MTKSLSLGLVCFRLRPDIVGGAERLMMKLGAELASQGHRVSFLSTAATTISQPDRWRVAWKEDRRDAGPGRLAVRSSDGTEHHLPIERLNIFPRLPWGRVARSLQQFEEANQARLIARLESADAGALRRLAPTPGDGWVLGPGWHLPEFDKGICRRWTMEKAALLAPAGHASGRLTLRGFALGRSTLKLGGGGLTREPSIPVGPGAFEAEMELPPGVVDGPSAYVIGVAPTQRPKNEARSLGVSIDSISWQPTGGPALAVPLHEVFTDAQLLRPWRDSFGGDAAWEARRRDAARLFDRARGPNVWFLGRALRRFAADRDALLFAGMPFATVNWPAKLPKDAPPHWILPFRHAEDPYYDWPHYEESLRRAAGSLLLTAAEVADLPAEIRERATVIGGGVDMKGEPAWPEPAERTSARRRLDLPEAATIVLILGRKHAGKGYLVVAAGVEAANQAAGLEPDAGFLLLLAGPDEDGLPIAGRHTRLLGRVDEETKGLLFRACDALCFLSQSESFGLVMLEAWAAGCPVIAGDRSGSVAEVARALGAPIVAPSPEAVAEALLDWRATPDAERRARWERGLTALRERYNWPAVARAAISAVDAVLQTRESARC